MTKNTLILCFFVLIKLGLHLWLISPEYDLHRDEYLHLDQAKHLAWGYVSVPPVTSWISCIILLLGNSVLWVKFFPALFGAFTMLVVWKTVETLKGNLFACILGAVSVIFSVVLRINILYQPNSLDILCWTLLYFAVIRYIHSSQNKWLWLASLAFAFGFLNKYNIVFCLLGLLPAILLSTHRNIFLNRHLYFSMLLVLLIMLPNLVWQFQNGFPVFHHLNQLTETQLVNVNRIDFLKEQVIFFLGSIFIIVLALISFFTYQPFRKYRMFFWSFIFTLVIFMYFRAKGYYAIGLYPVLIAFGAVYTEQLLQKSWKVYLRPVAVLFPLLLFIPFIRVAFPIYSPAQVQQNAQAYKDFNLLRWEDGKDHALPQDFADMLGWRELARKADSTFDGIADKQHTLVLCDNYGQAGAINFYSRHKDMQAVSFNADYINWFPLEEKEIKQVILVKEAEDTDRAEEKTLFGTVLLAGKIESRYAREQGTSIYLLSGAKTSINKILQQEITRRKNNR